MRDPRGALRPLLHPVTNPEAASFSSDGRVVAIRSNDGEVTLVDTLAGTERVLAPRASRVAVSPDGALVAIGSGWELSVVDAKDEHVVATTTSVFGKHCAFVEDGRSIVDAANEALVVISARTGEVRSRAKLPPEIVNLGALVGRELPRLLAGDGAYRTDAILKRLASLETGSVVAFSLDGATMAVARDRTVLTRGDRAVELVAYDDGAPIQVFTDGDRFEADDVSLAALVVRARDGSDAGRAKLLARRRSGWLAELVAR